MTSTFVEIHGRHRTALGLAGEGSRHSVERRREMEVKRRNSEPVPTISMVDLSPKAADVIANALEDKDVTPRQVDAAKFILKEGGPSSRFIGNPRTVPQEPRLSDDETNAQISEWLDKLVRVAEARGETRALARNHHCADENGRDHLIITDNDDESST